MSTINRINAICRRFRQTRIENGITQEDFAKTLGTNVSYVKAVERGRFEPNFGVIRRWSKHFQKSYRWIIDGKD